MEALFLYILKSGALLAAFFLAYYFLLRSETFFNSNRWFLLLGFAVSIFLPLITFTKIIWVARTADAMNWTNFSNGTVVTEPGFEPNWYLVSAMIYGIGLLVFLIKFVFDFGSLRRALRGKNVTQQADFKFVDVSEKVSPFSYFNYIVYNSSLYSELELENILEHEKVHCEQFHSVDVLISRLFCILFWYNPFVWLYQKAILQNLEFIADSVALKNISDKKAYQITLLKVTSHENCVAITNHFFQSLIKKRIVMLNKNQSKRWQSWKYFLIVPVLAAFMFYFQVKVIAQEKESPELALVKRSSETIFVTVDRNTTDTEMKQDAEMLYRNNGITLKFSKVKRNKLGEIIAIKIAYTDTNKKSGTYQVSSDEPIKSVRFFKNEDGSIGFGNGAQTGLAHRNGEVADNENATNDSEAEDSYRYSYVPNKEGDAMNENFEGPESPEPPEPPEPPQPIEGSVVVKTINHKDGKVTVVVNGGEINIDPEKILAGIDIEKIQAEANVQMALANKQLEKAGPELDRAQRQLEQSQRNIDRIPAAERAQARRDFEQSLKDIAQSKLDIEQSKRDLVQQRADLEQSKKELDQQKAELKAKMKAEQKK